jgi:multiple RNA-binding domain-containing protein 1
MFEVHGEVGRVVVPPAGTMAVVEFIHADGVAKAFRPVAYRRLGNSVIYLEIDPMGMFQETNNGTDESSRMVTSTAIKPVAVTKQEGSNVAGEDEPALSAGTTLFVKNLAFSTTVEHSCEYRPSLIPSDRPSLELNLHG